jgi:hypothetical protein
MNTTTALQFLRMHAEKTSDLCSDCCGLYVFNPEEGWEAGLVMAPEHREWFGACLHWEARGSIGPQPPAPTTPVYIECSTCHGTGRIPSGIWHEVFQALAKEIANLCERLRPVFVCKVCSGRHRCTEQGENGVWKMPETVTTEWHRNGWVLRCKGQCR